LLPVAIMGVAWMTDWLDRRANSVTDRATDRPWPSDRAWPMTERGWPRQRI